jgi:hypothetical protein
MVAVVALADVLALGVLLLVPLAGPLGLASLDIPVSAVLGWFFMVIPLAMALSALLARPLRLEKLELPAYLQTTFCLCALALVLLATMIIDTWIGVTDALDADVDIHQMRGFTAAAAALYSMNLLALWRPFVASLSESEGGEA